MGQIENKRMVDLNPNVSVITLYVTDWIKRQEPTTYCLWETHFKYEDINSLKMKK